MKKVFLIVSAIILAMLTYPIVYSIRIANYWKEYVEFDKALYINDYLSAIFSAVLLVIAVLVVVILIVLTLKKDLSILFSSTIGEKLAKSKEDKKQRQLERAKQKAEDAQRMLQELEKKDSD